MDRAHKFVVVLLAVIALLWTLAGLITLVYWSGLALWVGAAAAAIAFAWILRVYLRPTTVVEAEVSRQSVSR